MPRTEQVPLVLIVEDDPDLRSALGHLFSEEGYEAALASNGVDAIEALEQVSPCAVVLDLLMPGIIGQELLEHMRSETRLSRVPVAIISGKPDLAPDGYQVFPKPIDLPALLAYVRAACDGSRRRQR